MYKTEFVTDLDEGLLVSATYSGEKKAIVLKFYDPATEKIVSWLDNTGHLPYCYSKSTSGELKANLTSMGRSVSRIEDEVKKDLLTDSIITVSKIVAADPLAISGAGAGQGIRDVTPCWEADIKYYETYIYDKELKVGTFYKIADGKLIELNKEVPEAVQKSLDAVANKESGELAGHIREWSRLLGQPLVSFKRIACDIEVANEEGRIPNPEKPTEPVIAVSFHGSTESLVYLLERKDKMTDTLPPNAVLFPDEKSLLKATFSKMAEYPFVLTFNGDEFDFPYLRGRALFIGINEDDIPIIVGRNETFLKTGIHIDLYKFFHNRSIQIYVYNKKYSAFKLNDISEALLGKEKLEFDGNIKDLPLGQMAEYCLNDSVLTYELTSERDSLMMKVLLILTRAAKMPMNDVSRLGVSNWIRSMLFYEHRKMGALIPNQDDLKIKGEASTMAMIKGKNYKGGLVIEPKAGVYFKVSVLDFASLYPSVIKKYNLSYETVNCVHKECETNLVPETTHWVCKKKSGIESLSLGSLRELRVHHYKHLSKDKSLSKEARNLYDVVSQGLKVFLNAAYGSMGFESFALYCLPVAECTAALGRWAITKAIEEARRVEMEVIYSDTDSIYLQDATPEKMKLVEDWAIRELGLEIEVDKTYRYVAFSSRKKNYFGVLEDGTVDIKGLTGKKSMTPALFKKAFYESIDILKTIYTKDDFEKSKTEIRKLLSTMISRLKNKEISLEDVSFHMALGSETKEYKGTVQHVTAAKLHEEKTGTLMKAGDIIAFVKTRSGAKPVSMASVKEIDTDKYLEYAEKMFDQILEPLGLTFDELMGATQLDSFFGTS